MHYILVISVPFTTSWLGG